MLLAVTPGNPGVSSENDEMIVNQKIQQLECKII